MHRHVVFQLLFCYLPDNDDTFPIYLLDRSHQKHFHSRKLVSRTGADERAGDSLHRASKPVIILARCFALFPVLGINEKHADGLL